jgi:hypothetical protein
LNNSSLRKKKKMLLIKQTKQVTLTNNLSA